MMVDPKELVDEFVRDLRENVGISVSDSAVSHDRWPAPQTAKDLPKGQGAVYVFSLSSGSSAPAGSGRALT